MNETNNNQGAQERPEGNSNDTRYIAPQSGYEQGYSPPPGTQGSHGTWPPQGQGPLAPPQNRDRQRTFFAMVLIAAGMLFLLQQFAVFRNFGDYVLLVIGGVFMYAYFTTRQGFRSGFLIPGSILLGIGTGQVLQSLDVLGIWRGANLSGLTLGLGFCLIFALERRQWWALIPGGILVASSLSDILMIGRLWPIGLILLGGYLLYEQYRRGQMR